LAALKHHRLNIIIATFDFEYHADNAAPAAKNYKRSRPNV